MSSWTNSPTVLEIEAMDAWSCVPSSLLRCEVEVAGWFLVK